MAQTFVAPNGIAVHPSGKQALITTQFPDAQLFLWTGSLNLIAPPKDFPHIGSASWHPDGKQFSFITLIPGGLWLHTAGKLTPLHHQSTPIVWQAWSPDGTYLAYVQESPEISQVSYSKKERRTRLELWVLSWDKTGQVQRQKLSTPDEHLGSFRGFAGVDWGKDSQHLTYVSKLDSEEQWNTGLQTVLHEIDVPTQKRRVLDKGRYVGPKISPSGRYVACVYEKSGQFFLDAEIRVLDRTTGQVVAHLQTPDAYPGLWHLDLIGWQDEDTILFYESEGTYKRIGRVSVATGKPSWWDDRIGVITAPSLSANGQWMGFSFEGFDAPPEAYLSSIQTFAPKALSAWNVALPHQGSAEVMSWISPEGDTVEALLILPKIGQKPYPLIVQIHGGPMGVFSQYFLGTPSREVGALIGAGYAVLQVNVHGSSGYGAKFRRSVVGDIGGIDYRDILQGVDKVVAEGWADPNRLGVVGWSYGGYQTAWIVSQTNRFKAAVAGAGVYNAISMSSLTDNIQWLQDYIAAKPDYHEMKAYRDRSPLFHASKIQTPLLLVHGDVDTIVPLSQSEELYSALLVQEKPVELWIYPGHGHRLMTPEADKDYQDKMVAWFKKYL